MKVTQEFLEKLTKKLADEGRLVEAGWLALRYIVIPDDAPQAQVEEMQKAFFAGAQHVFASMMNMFEPGQDATEKDMHRIDLIYDELEAWKAQMQAQGSSYVQ